MRLKIISDGHPWGIDKENMGVAVIEIRGVEVDLVAKAVLHVPLTKGKKDQ